MIKPQRVELKYFLTTLTKQRVLNLLSKVCHSDKNAVEGGGYNISSVYFDSYKLKCHSDWVGGQCERFKLRLRWYNKQNKIYKLEIKRKSNDKIYKHVIPVNSIEAHNLLKGQIPNRFEKLNELDQFIKYLFKVEGFKPSVRVDYDRLPLIYKFDRSLRFTIDSNIVICKSLNLGKCIETRPLFQSHLRVFEIKSSSNIPKFVKNMVDNLELVQESISKYSNAIHQLKLNL